MRSASSIFFIFGLILTLCFFDIYEARSTMGCTPCTEDECEKMPPDVCPFGITKDACHRNVCAKGPGERCGGPFLIFGNCGEGLMCTSKERCSGCSQITFECY